MEIRLNLEEEESDILKDAAGILKAKNPTALVTALSVFDSVAETLQAYQFVVNLRLENAKRNSENQDYL